jgi:hypothetical protein
VSSESSRLPDERAAVATLDHDDRASGDARPALVAARSKQRLRWIARLWLLAPVLYALATLFGILRLTNAQGEPDVPMSADLVQQVLLLDWLGAQWRARPALVLGAAALLLALAAWDARLGRARRCG